MKKLEVVVSPEITSDYVVEGKLVVIIDIFRATTTIVTAMENGIKEVKTCLEVKDAIALKNDGYIAGGERNGEKVLGMDIDNSPSSFLEGNYENKKLAISTTNGTKAVATSLKAREIIIGAFVNISAVVSYIKQSDLDVLLVCAGWKGKMSTEDLLFAGAVVSELSNEIVLTDSSEIALTYFLGSKPKLEHKLYTCEHAQRLKKLHKEKDLAFCIQRDVYTVVPKYKGGSFVL